MYIDSHLERCVLVQTAELYSSGKYLNRNLNFFQLWAYVSYGEFFKVPCATVYTRAVQVKSGIYIDSHLERCVLVQTAELYTPGKYLNWKSPMGPYTSCTGQVWHVYIDSHLERCVLVQTAELYTPGKYLNWKLNFINCGPILAMENFSKSPVGPRTRGVQVKSGMYIDSHLERCVLVQTAELYTPGKYLNWNLKICPIYMYCMAWEMAIIAIEYRIAGMFGREKVWRIWRIASD